VAISLLATLSGCAEDSAAPTKKDSTTATDATPDDTTAATDASSGGSDVATAPFPVSDCDPLVPGVCALPFPSNLYLKPDAGRKTGYSLQFGQTSLPKSAGDVRISPEPYQRLDGYGVGSSLVTQFGALDLSGMAIQTSIDKSVADNSATIWLEVSPAGEVVRRIPHWNELDERSNTEDLLSLDPTTQLLFTRPGVVLNYGTRYVVAFRNLKGKDGKAIARSPAFDQLAKGQTAGNPELAPRQARFDEVFAILQKAGVPKEEVTLAWDFVTYSNDAIHGQLLEMRDKALAAIGTDGATLTFDKFEDQKDGKPDPNIAYTLRGTFRAPDFTKKVLISGTEGSQDAVYVYRWNFGPAGELVQNGWRESAFWIRIPHSAMDGKVAHDFLQYGHGLNGDGGETYAGWAGPNANQRKFIYIASNMIGMSEDDVPAIINMLTDMNRFAALPERVTAGVVEHLVFARTMKLRGGELLSKALSDHLKKPVTISATGKVFWSGNSQGGIYGQTVVAASTDITRGHLGQAGINYSMLLERSVDFDSFSMVLAGMYPDRRDYVVLLSLMQLLWDHVDPVTFVRHIEAEPFAGTPKHAVLSVIHPGDFQVDPVTQEIVARSGFYKLMKHYGRAVPLLPETDYPYSGSALVSIDFGNGWFQQSNIPPKAVPGLLCGTDLPQADGKCRGPALCDPAGLFDACTLEDPHDRAHGLAAHNDQMRHFFDTGEVKDFCGGDGCKPE
jgi:hypothetical protein